MFTGGIYPIRHLMCQDYQLSCPSLGSREATREGREGIPFIHICRYLNSDLLDKQVNRQHESGSYQATVSPVDSMSSPENSWSIEIYLPEADYGGATFRNPLSQWVLRQSELFFLNNTDAHNTAPGQYSV